MSLSSDLYKSFIRYQGMVKKEFEVLARRHQFVEVDGERSVAEVNGDLRARIAAHLGIRSTRFRPSSAMTPLWR